MASRLDPKEAAGPVAEADATDDFQQIWESSVASASLKEIGLPGVLLVKNWGETILCR